MSNSLVPKKDAGSSVVGEVANDAVTAGIAIGTVVVYGMVPVFGWVVLLAGGGWIGLRAVKRGLRKAKR